MTAPLTRAELKAAIDILVNTVSIVLTSAVYKRFSAHSPEGIREVVAELEAEGKVKFTTRTDGGFKETAMDNFKCDRCGKLCDYPRTHEIEVCGDCAQVLRDEYQARQAEEEHEFNTARLPENCPF